VAAPRRGSLGDPNIGLVSTETERVSLHGPTEALMTELLQLPAMDYGTVYHHISEMRIYRTVGAAVIKDIFVWIVGTRRSVNHFNCAA